MLHNKKGLPAMQARTLRFWMKSNTLSEWKTCLLTVVNERKSNISHARHKYSLSKFGRIGYDNNGDKWVYSTCQIVIVVVVVVVNDDGAMSTVHLEEKQKTKRDTYQFSCESLNKHSQRWTKWWPKWWKGKTRDNRPYKQCM